MDDGDPSGDEPVVVPIEDALDLHPFAPRDIPSVVASYLEAACEAGFEEVRLIHGRGIGVQRARVQSVLAAHPLVAAYRDAPPDRGGLGATLVRLRTAAPPAPRDRSPARARTTAPAQRGSVYPWTRGPSGVK